MHLSMTENVALIRINTGKANAVNPAFAEALSGLLDQAEAAGAGAVVLTGYDRFFSAGLDLPALLALDRTAMTHFITEFNALMLRVFTAPYPVVAALNGHAIAGGCVLALQADWRLLAAGDAKVGLNEVQLGISLPCVVIETLRPQVPPASLLPIALEGRLFPPDDALRLGLVHELVPPAELEARALAKARVLAAVPAAAFRQVKLDLRRPALERLQLQGADDRGFLDTWFSEAGQKRIRAAVESLTRKR